MSKPRRPAQVGFCQKFCFNFFLLVFSSRIYIADFFSDFDVLRQRIAQSVTNLVRSFFLLSWSSKNWTSYPPAWAGDERVNVSETLLIVLSRLATSCVTDKTIAAGVKSWWVLEKPWLFVSMCPCLVTKKPLPKRLFSEPPTGNALLLPVSVGQPRISSHSK